ncbi:nitrogen fixation protein NifM [Marinospirillum sp.]|uniref:nitrogen fixation protein NifM n=1 Tax=Marinospirillum sp. TaxID=2183934 RepID=UPI0028706D6F|nr:nitrogen fixation protein NifM [Marinospirillum sp.]MDR9467090.1 nitrogen fixation protein NifM [Marinospirillum sp.]
MSLDTQAIHRYQLLKIAQGRFNKKLAELSIAELEKATAQAKRQYQLEEKVLTAPESQQVYLPAATLEDAWLRVKERYEHPADFDRALDNLQLSRKAYKACLKRELLIEAILDKVASKASEVSDEEALEFYHRNPDKFSLPEKRQTRHLLITVEEALGSAGELQALRQMDEILAQLEEDGSNFGKLALQYSQCPTAVEGGQLGKVPPGLLYDELDRALFRMPAGHISQPLRSPLGYHLIFCEKVYPAEFSSFLQAREKIVEFIADTRRSKVQKQWIQQL